MSVVYAQIRVSGADGPLDPATCQVPEGPPRPVDDVLADVHALLAAAPDTAMIELTGHHAGRHPELGPEEPGV